MTGDGSILRATAYPPAWRVVAALLRVVSGASLPVLFFLLLTVNDPPLAPPLLLRLFLIWAAVPAAAAWLIRRALQVDIRVNSTQLELARRDVRVAIPVDAIRNVVAWSIPLPHPGVSLQLRSGQRFRWGLALDDPSRLLAKLPLPPVAHPSLVYAHAKAMQPPRRPLHVIAKFAGFALFPATVLFYTHQFIAHGGPLGEYYTFGLAAYLTTYAVFWSTITIYLVLYASIWRGVAEFVSLVAAWTIPRSAAGVRRWAERGSALLYYGGVPVILALRYLA